MDGALEYLRRNYPEYRRKQAVPFRKYLALQVPEVRRRIEARREKEEKEKEKEKELEVRNAPRSRAEEEEDRLREREDAHMMEIDGVGDMNEDMAFDVEEKDTEEGEKGQASVVVVTASSNKVADDEERERPAFAPPHVIAEVLRAATMRPLKSPQLEPRVERGSPLAQSSARPVQLVKTFSQFQGSVVQQENGRPYLPLVSISKSEKPIQNDVRESTGVAQESKLVRKREREIEKARAGSKKGKWIHEKGDKEAPEDGAGNAGSSAAAVPRNVSFKDFGGIEGVLGMIRDLIEYPLVHPNVYDHLGVQPPRGVLLHGPPGCGKTMLANAIAVETGVPFLKISAPEVVSGMSGLLLALLMSLLCEVPPIIFL